MEQNKSRGEWNLSMEGCPGRGGGGGGGTFAIIVICRGVQLNNGICTPYTLTASLPHTHSLVHSPPSGMHALFEGKMTDMHITQGYTVCK